MIQRRLLKLIQAVPEFILAEDVGHVAEKIHLQIEHLDPNACEAFVDKSSACLNEFRQFDIKNSCGQVSTLNEVVEHRVTGVFVTSGCVMSSSVVV